MFGMAHIVIEMNKKIYTALIIWLDDPCLDFAGLLNSYCFIWETKEEVVCFYLTVYLSESRLGWRSGVIMDLQSVFWRYNGTLSVVVLVKLVVWLQINIA